MTETNPNDADARLSGETVTIARSRWERVVGVAACAVEWADLDTDDDDEDDFDVCGALEEAVRNLKPDDLSDSASAGAPPPGT